nr:hypothetical protein [Tanacetum cinerariifolium]
MNYQPVTVDNQSNPSACIQKQFDAKKAGEKIVYNMCFLLYGLLVLKIFRTLMDASFEVKEHEFKGMNLESEVYVSPRSSAQTRKHDDKTKREAKGKSPVKYLTGYRNLSASLKISLMIALMRLMLLILQFMLLGKF